MLAPPPHPQSRAVIEATPPTSDNGANCSKNFRTRPKLNSPYSSHLCLGQRAEPAQWD